MKKYLISTLFLLIPLVSFAETQEKQNKEEKEKEIVYVYVNEPQESHAGFFVETYVGLYSDTTVKIKMPYYENKKEKTKNLNDSGSFALGVDISGAQLGFIAKQIDHDDDNTSFFGLKLDVPFIIGKVQPFISVVGGLAIIDFENDDISESAFSYGVGGGVRYNFDEHAFAKLGLLFESVTFDFDDYDMKIKSSALSLQFSIGYKF